MSSKWFNDVSLRGPIRKVTDTNIRSKESESTKEEKQNKHSTQSLSRLDNARLLAYARWYVVRSMFPLVGIHQNTYAYVYVDLNRVRPGIQFRWGDIFNHVWRTAFKARITKRIAERHARLEKRVMSEFFVNFCMAFGIIESPESESTESPKKSTSEPTRFRSVTFDDSAWVLMLGKNEIARMKYPKACAKRLPAHMAESALLAVTTPNGSTRKTVDGASWESEGYKLTQVKNL